MSASIKSNDEPIFIRFLDLDDKNILIYLEMKISCNKFLWYLQLFEIKIYKNFISYKLTLFLKILFASIIN